jgi:hypothetical protein
MADIVNLRAVRKRKAREAEQVHAAENRIKFGRTKAEKQLEKAEAERESKNIDAHKRED